MSRTLHILFSSMKSLFVGAFLFAYASFSCELFAQEDRPTTGNILSDARLIVTSGRGEVRIWHKPPRVMVLTDNPNVIDEVERIISLLEENVSPLYGPNLFESLSYSRFPRDFGRSNAEYSFSIRTKSPDETYVQVNLGPKYVYEVDLVVAVGSRSQIAILNGLWGLPLQNQSIQMRGRTWPCFYSSRSRNGQRRGAFVSIVDQGQKIEDLNVCIWEEFLHSMGPLIDAEGSNYFSFDDSPTQSSFKIENDILLLKSLYESGIERGDNADKAISYLHNLLDQK